MEDGAFATPGFDNIHMTAQEDGILVRSAWKPGMQVAGIAAKRFTGIVFLDFKTQLFKARSQPVGAGALVERYRIKADHRGKLAAYTLFLGF